MTTIKDIAKISGYSISTVSRVLNNRADVSEKAREKIEKVIRELNYQPNENARMLKQNVSSDISVIVRGNKSIFLESILEEIQIRMGKHGESVNVQFIGETDDEVATAVQIGQYLKPKGFIFLGGSADHFRDSFSQISLPSVLVTVDVEKLGFENLSSFTTDDEAAAGCAAGKLLSLGHKRIGIIGGDAGVVYLSHDPADTAAVDDEAVAVPAYGLAENILGSSHERKSHQYDEGNYSVHFQMILACTTVSPSGFEDCPTCFRISV